MSKTNGEYYEFKRAISIPGDSEDLNTSCNYYDRQYIKVHSESRSYDSLTGRKLRDFNGEQREKMYLSINKKLGEY